MTGASDKCATEGQVDVGIFFNEKKNIKDNERMSKKFLLGSVPQVVEGTTSWRDFCNSKCLFNDSRIEDIRSGCAMYTVKADG